MIGPIVGVMGPGGTARDEDVTVAEALGRRIAEAGWTLLTGGRDAGVMAAANRGAKAAGGTTIGVLPGATREGLSPDVDLPIVTGLGNARNAVNVLSSDIVVACGMGLGTASEIALALKTGKPVILLNGDERSRAFWTALSPRRVHVAGDVDTAIRTIQDLL